MKEKFTKGPWIVNDGDNFSKGILITSEDILDWVSICELDVEFDGHIGVEQKANAHLIACAPDMYEMLDSACNELYALINEVNNQKLASVNSQTETPPDLHDMETCHLIQQLLKRARGE